MQKFLLSFLLIGFLFFCFSQSREKKDAAGLLKAYLTADKIYQQAESLYSRAGEDEALQAKADETYLQALASFNKLIPAVEKEGNDSLAFFILAKTGFIQYYFDSTNAAKADYLEALALKQKLPSIADSFSFIPYLY